MFYGVSALSAMWTLLAAAAVAGQPIYGLAVAGDGDSLTIGDERIRLFGIDAPEFDQTCTKSGSEWPCGQQAADLLARLTTGRQVRCVKVGDDGFGRTLARCSVGGTDINQAMVSAGYAVAFRKYSTDYVDAETSAKAALRGIWSGEFRMPSEVRAEGRGRPQASAKTRSTRRVPLASLGACNIKGNRSRRGEWIYHLPGMPYYERTRPEEIFCSEAAAVAAGYRRAIVR